MSVSKYLIFQRTRYDQEQEDNRRQYTMSRYADCSSLKSLYNGPYRLSIKPGNTQGKALYILTIHTQLAVYIVVLSICAFIKSE